MLDHRDGHTSRCVRSQTLPTQAVEAGAARSYGSVRASTCGTGLRCKSVNERSGQRFVLFFPAVYQRRIIGHFALWRDDERVDSVVAAELRNYTALRA